MPGQGVETHDRRVERLTLIAGARCADTVIAGDPERVPDPRSLMVERTEDGQAYVLFRREEAVEGAGPLTPPMTASEIASQVTSAHANGRWQLWMTDDVYSSFQETGLVSAMFDDAAIDHVCVVRVE